MTRSCGRLALILAAAATAAGTPGRAGAVGLSLQGTYGVGQFGRDLNSKQDATYGAIAGLHFGGPIQLELDYQHASNDLNGAFASASITQDALLGHVRLDLLPGPLDPFVYGGVGWVHTSAGGIVSSTGDQVALPIGAGIELWFKPLVLGVRGEYQWFPNDVAGKTADYWKVIGTIGVRLP